MVAAPDSPTASGGDLERLLAEQVSRALEPVVVKIRHEAADAAHPPRESEPEGTAEEPRIEVERVPVRASHEPQTDAPAPSGADARPRSRQAAKEPDTLGGAFAELVRAVAGRAEAGIGARLLPPIVGAIAGVVRATIRRHAREALHGLLDDALRSAPSSVAGEQVRTQAAEELERVLDEMIESALAGPISTDLTRHGERVIGALLRGDLAQAEAQLEGAAHDVLTDALAVLQPHWSRLLRVLLPVIVKAAGSAMGSKVKEGVEELGTGNGQSPEPKRTAPRAARSVKERKDRVSDLFSDSKDTLRRQLEAEVKSVNQRLKDGVEDAAKKATRNRQLGRPPAGPGRSSRRAPGQSPGRSPARRGIAGRHPATA